MMCVLRGGLHGENSACKLEEATALTHLASPAHPGAGAEPSLPAISKQRLTGPTPQALLSLELELIGITKLQYLY